ncbi:Endonuclease III [Pseudoalteromonas holothuriae]|uniref:Endonuclease III n=1 Tax=Pseudoalteromonas holothuriae TaxID=2963714 RepID=A0ABN8UH71_9GAMM|nr:Endonuclease III [Pseudoalteromonas sp. CIP111951]
MRNTSYLALLSFVWPTIALDTHIDRVPNRTKFAMGKNVVEVEKKLEKVVPVEFKVDVQHWLILHGRYVSLRKLSIETEYINIISSLNFEQLVKLEALALFDLTVRLCN